MLYGKLLFTKCDASCILYVNVYLHLHLRSCQFLAAFRFLYETADIRALCNNTRGYLRRGCRGEVSLIGGREKRNEKISGQREAQLLVHRSCVVGGRGGFSLDER